MYVNFVQSVAAVIQSAVHALLSLVLVEFSESSLGDMKVRSLLCMVIIWLFPELCTELKNAIYHIAG